MRLAHICPPRLLNKLLSHDDTYHLCLMDLVLNDGDYAQFYRKRSLSGRDFVILDSNAFEKPGEAAAISKLAQAAAIISADAVILPDAIGESGDQTFHRSLTSLKNWQVLPGHKSDQRFWVCPHGSDYNDYLDCAQKMASIPGVSGVCIFEETMPSYGEHRIDVARDVYGLIRRGTTIHLLGMLEDLSDLCDPWVQEHVLGCDSAKLVRWGMNNDLVEVGEIPSYPGRGSDYFSRQALSESQTFCVRANLDYWNKLVRGTMSLPDTPKLTVGGAFSQTSAPEKALPKYRADKDGDIQDSGYRFDLLPPKALAAAAHQMWAGSEKYGVHDEFAWKQQAWRRHLNHMQGHINSFLAGDRSEKHLANIVCDAMFALELYLEEHGPEEINAEHAILAEQEQAWRSVKKHQKVVAEAIEKEVR